MDITARKTSENALRNSGSFFSTCRSFLTSEREQAGLAGQDSGPCIKSEHLCQLFDRLSASKDACMGLGLPISRSIGEAHFGCIRADNAPRRAAGGRGSM